jgi:hypothetical protein
VGATQLFAMLTKHPFQLHWLALCNMVHVVAGQSVYAMSLTATQLQPCTITIHYWMVCESKNHTLALSNRLAQLVSVATTG